MTSSWDEVKRLAADFQKAQLSSTLQRLSERNCIEIVQLLLENHMIDLIFTNDGKEYLTPQHLVQEILGELYVHGGRINLVELAKIINVDLAHINNYVPEVIRMNKDIHLVLGQLLDNTYIATIAADINEKLQQQGQIFVGDLTIQYSLPGDFLQHNVIEKQLGRIIQGRQDPVDRKVFFTEAFVARTKAKIRGGLAALTKPTPVNVILSQIEVQEKLFFSLVDEVAQFGTLTGKLAGARYIPHIYARSQSDWVKNFYRQNGYLEFDALARLGISDHKNYVKRHLANEDMEILNTCVISKRVLDQIDADIEECIASSSYADIQNNVPSIFNSKDFELIIERALMPERKNQVMLFSSFILSTAFIDILAATCDKVLADNAKKVVESGKYQQFQVDLQSCAYRATFVEERGEDSRAERREERRKRALGGKAGGGAQGRETRSKSMKKQTYGSKKHPQNNDDDDCAPGPAKKHIIELEIISLEEVKEAINDILENECLEELSNVISGYILPKLNKKGLEIAKSLYASTISNQVANRRQTHATVQDHLNTLIGDVRLFEKGAKMLPADVQTQFYKYLIKTLCNDIANEIIRYLCSEAGFDPVNHNLTNEQRNRIVNELSPDIKPIIQALIKTLSGSSVEEFMAAVENCLAACSMILKKIDKKKDKIIIMTHKQGLLEQLLKCEDPALVLHLATLVIFEVATQNMIHASGRHVAALLTYLKQYLTDQQVADLAEYHDLVTSYLTNNAEHDAIGENLKAKMNNIKAIASGFKRVSSTVTSTN